MDAKKASYVGGATLIGAGMLAARSLGPKLHEQCKSAGAGKCAHGEDKEDQPAERKCSPKAACAAAMNAEEVK